MNFELLFWLVVAHFVGDYGLQSDWVAKNKCKSWYVLTAHTFIWMGCIALPLTLFGTLNWQMVVILSTHWVFDWAKCKGFTNLLEDQITHFIQLGFVFMMSGVIQ